MNRSAPTATGRPRVATAPVNWYSAALQSGAPLDVPTMLDEMKAAGYDATEVSDDFPYDPDALMHALEAHGLTACGAYVWLDLTQPDLATDDRERLLGRLRLLQRVGGDIVISLDMAPERVAIAGHVSPDAGLTDAAWASVAANLQTVGRLAADHHVHAHYHNHVGTYVETPAEVERLIAALPTDGSVDLCFDCGHYAYGGGDTVAFIEQYGGRIGYVHVKDVDAAVLADARAQGWGFDEAVSRFVFTELGNGSASIDRVVGGLVEQGYGGWLVVEQDSCRQSCSLSARQNRDYLRTMFGL